MGVTVGSRIGPYEIVAALGAGGMGEVYRARDTNLGREVALKVLPDSFAQDPERLARFEREAKTLASLNHPNIAIVHGLEKAPADTGLCAGALVMELIEGPTLADRIVAGPMPLDEALAIARQIADALDTAHELGIVHRDLKPANIKLRADGAVKVLDFGLAKIVEPVAASSSSLTLSPTITSPALMSGVGVLLGTAAYMSPEQARGRAVDKRADIWAFGCVLWEMLVGERLFKGEDITETLASVVKDEPRWERAPAKVRPALRACLERDPKKRLRDIGDVWRLLADDPPAPVAPSRASRMWIGWSIAGLLMAAVVGLGIDRFRQPTPPRGAPLRFRIPFPANNRPLRSIHAVSPDGQRLAFVAGDEAGRRSRLWVHELHSLESRPLPGTEGAIGSPFWTADSRTIVFATAGRQPLQSPNTLKKIAIAGGPALTLGTIPSILRGGFGTAHGTLVLGVGTQPLFEMASAGGSLRPLTSVAKDETGHYYPTLLPDGRHFLYLRAQGVNRGAIHLGTLGQTSAAGPDPRVMDQSTNVVYVPSYDAGHGFIVFADNDALLAVPFDEKAMRVTGEPVPVSQGVSRGVSDPQLALISGAGDTLIYQEAGSLASRQFTWVDRRGTPIGKVGEPGQFGDSMRLSPSGSRLVYTVRDGTRQEIWLYDFERGNRSRLVQNPGTNWAPVWSHDESTIIYTSSQKAPVALYRISVSGGGVEQRLVDGANTSDWSRDGRYVVFQSLPAGRERGLFLLPDPARGSGGTPIRLTDSAVPEDDATLSPDGHLIAYVSSRSGAPEVYVRSLDPAAPLKLGPESHVSTDGGTQPRWRADAHELVYQTTRGIMAVTIETRPALRIGQPRLLFALPNDAESWDMSSDGSRFLVAMRVGDYTAPPFTVLLNWQSAIGR